MALARRKDETPVAEEIQQDYRDLLTRKLKEMVPAEARYWCTPQTGLLEGQPYEEIVTYADKKDIDLIIMGSHSCQTTERRIYGSIAEAVSRDAGCPVMIIHP